MLKATVQGLQSLRRPDEVAATRGLTISQVLPVVAKKDEPEPEPVATPASEATETTETKDDGEAEDHADA
jgi:hypothetical protein